MESLFKDPFWSYEKRLKTFKSSWPFKDDSPCSPKEMASSGFYFVGNRKEPDLVRCYYCLRELDGWEPTDIPREEHARKSCPFIELDKGHEDLTLLDALHLESEREIAILKNKYQVEEDIFMQNSAKARQQMMDLIESNTLKRKSRARRKKA